MTGTPTDAVMPSINRVMKDSPPDLLLSGVNRGAKLAEDVTYSRTVSAVMEGVLAGMPSVALSQTYGPDACPSPPPANGGGNVLKKLLAYEFPARTLVNINFPARTSIRCKAFAPLVRACATMGDCRSLETRIRVATPIAGSASIRW